MNHTLLVFLLLIALAAPLAGCASTSDPSKSHDTMLDLIPGHKDAALRQKVEADNFPTAEKAGIQ
jgi:hypothetical protein